MSSGTSAPPRTARPAPDLRPAVTVLAGFRPTITSAVTEALLAADPGLVALRHDLSRVADGLVRREVRTSVGVVEQAEVSLVHGCVSCTLREDVLPTLVRLAREAPWRDILLVLPYVVEPEEVAAAVDYCLVDGAPVTEALRFDSYVTVVDPDTLLDDLASTDELVDRGIGAVADDRRTVAEVIAAQIEYADTVLLPRPAAEGAYDTARLRALLDRLAPWTRLVVLDGPDAWQRLGRTLRGAGLHDPDSPGVLGRGLEGRGLGTDRPEPDCGVVSVLYTTRRPLHPQRLHAALEDLNDGALRSRGHFWLSSQPDRVLAWQAAGGALSMWSMGNWLVSTTGEAWNDVSAHRRVAASLHWDPYYGDRDTQLCFVGLDLDAAALRSTLDSCLLTDAELAEGEDSWRGWPDPFAAHLDADGAGTEPAATDDQPADVG